MNNGTEVVGVSLPPKIGAIRCYCENEDNMFKYNDSTTNYGTTWERM